MNDNIQLESAKRLLAVESYKESLKRQWEEREKEWARLFDNKEEALKRAVDLFNAQPLRASECFGRSVGAKPNRLSSGWYIDNQ